MKMNSNRKMILAIIAVIVVVAIGAYALYGNFGPKEELKIATTTSLEDTGLLEELEAAFESKNPNVDVQFVAVGTGQALEYGRKGDVDLVMVHAKAQEDKFIEEGYGINRTVFAYNYFYIVGPASDPAKINGTNATTAFKNLMTSGTADPSLVSFVSRGDNSGTNTREIQIWNKTGADYNSSIRGQPWYTETGKGMGDTLTLANQKNAYTLSDSGTYLAFKGDLTLVPLVTQGKDLLNIYSMIPLNTTKFPNTNSADADKWIAFVMSDEGQKIIEEYGKAKYGQTLFTPLAGQPEPTN